MPPLSYALLNEVLQYPTTPAERIGPETLNNIAQNTNIISPNGELAKDCPCPKKTFHQALIEQPMRQIEALRENFREYFTSSGGGSTDELLREQIFLTKLLIFMLIVMFIMFLFDRK